MAVSTNIMLQPTYIYIFKGDTTHSGIFSARSLLECLCLVTTSFRVGCTVNQYVYTMYKDNNSIMYMYHYIIILLLTLLQDDTAVCGVTSLPQRCRKSRPTFLLRPEKQAPFALSNHLVMTILNSSKRGGGSLKKAKEYNNVIGTPFFNIPVDQVSCSIYNKLIMGKAKHYCELCKIISGMSPKRTPKSWCFLQNIHLIRKYTT